MLLCIVDTLLCIVDILLCCDQYRLAHVMELAIRQQ